MIPPPRKINPEAGLETTYVISSDTPIGECIDLMRREHLTALIVCDSEFEIEGIFTDRDVFLKVYKSELSKAFWEFPVRAIMSRPVFGLAHDLLHLASELMVDHGIRHIPVIRKGADQKITILGLITQDSVFKSNIKSTRSWRDFMKVNTQKMSVGIFSDDKLFIGDVIAAFKPNKNFQVKELRREEIYNTAMLKALVDSYNSFVIDTDLLEAKPLQKLFSELSLKKGMQKLIVLTHPDKMTLDYLKILKLLQKTNGFQLVLKPVNGGTFLQLFMGPTEFSKK